MTALFAPSRLTVADIAKNFTLHIRGGTTVQGFAGISFSLPAGQILALTGASGAGKSSILKSIYRTYLVNQGSILFRRGDGTEVDLATCSEQQVLALRRREMGFVTQFLKILPRVSAVDTVASPLLELGVAEEEARFRAGAMLKQLGIKRELFDLSPLTFSGGEQQRVNIARGIIAPKELILLDEPTASLDQHSAEIVLEQLANLKKQGISMIAIFHDQRKIDRVADQVIQVGRSSS